MGHEVTIGGERLGSGKKMKAYLHNYERSTHDLGYVWRSTMSAGTLVPFMSEVALPGDTFDINLNVDVLTHPTIGPLFGSYKIQLDVFQAPIRLYQGKLHQNKLGIGMDMSKVKLPLLEMSSSGIDKLQDLDNQQINPSCILKYLGMSGLGQLGPDATGAPLRQFNAIPFLAYWDIYKNYYANKQEEIGVVIHKDVAEFIPTIAATALFSQTVPNAITIPTTKPGTPTYVAVTMQANSSIRLGVSNISAGTFVPENLNFGVQLKGSTQQTVVPATRLFTQWEIQNNGYVIGFKPNKVLTDLYTWGWIEYVNTQSNQNPDQEPQLTQFPLENIDTMRQNLLSHFADTPYTLNAATLAPYGLVMQAATWASTSTYWAKLYSQEGLAIKTYQSDLFNNWISTEWIDGPEGISAITAIDTTGGSFTIDELNMSKKVYDMLNRIAISGGTYDDWLDAVYTHERQRSAENPMYLGGAMQSLVFQEVVSNAATAEAPLGTLAGRGKITGDKKGGEITAKIDEPSYLIGIISITPRIDYSQGNKWDVNLLTMNDLHKPALDEIGFQDLITDQMAWWDTRTGTGYTRTFQSAGKQPAWINYMTNVNKVYGNFANASQQMFMVLARRYEPDYTGALPTIKDLTTYIDPAKFNHIFADTRRDAQNFWAQIGVNITARRKMSAKVMPNL